MFSFLFFTAYLIAQNFLAVQSSAVALTELHFCWSLLWAVASTVVRVADIVCVESIHHFVVQSQSVSEKVQYLSVFTKERPLQKQKRHTHGQ